MSEKAVFPDSVRIEFRYGEEVLAREYKFGGGVVRDADTLWFYLVKLARETIRNRLYSEGLRGRYLHSEAFTWEQPINETIQARRDDERSSISGHG